jgi:hypothetical protein
MDTRTISIAFPPPNNGPGRSGGLEFNSFFAKRRRPATTE